MLSWLCPFLFVLTVSHGAEIREPKTRRGQIEELESKSWSFITSYLDYEEPTYNQSVGFTADDFVDNLEGYQTQPSHAKSFGWETSGNGQVPYAALLVNLEKTKFCMSTVLTVSAVVTPCGCVRTKGFEDFKAVDHEVQGNDPNILKRRRLYYTYDLGDKIDVVANHVEFIPEHVWTDIYPSVKQVLSGYCFNVWKQTKVDKWVDESQQLEQMFFPAVLLLSNNLEFEATIHWPPIHLEYKDESEFTAKENKKKKFFYYYNADEKEPPTSIISSYNFLPLDDKDLSKDNDGNNVIETKNRLVNLNVKLCSQNLCNESYAFKELNRLLYSDQKLESMYCWCDVPWVDAEVIYQQVKDEDAPVYFKSVYGGYVGAPVVHQGIWVGWTVEPVTRKASKNGLRATWTRGINAYIIRILELMVPELKNAYRPHISDVNRAKFAIHDLRRLWPDPELKVDDVDMVAWAQVGEPRFEVHERKLEARKRSGAPAVSPAHLLILFCMIFEIFKM